MTVIDDEYLFFSILDNWIKVKQFNDNNNNDKNNYKQIFFYSKYNCNSNQTKNRQLLHSAKLSLTSATVTLKFTGVICFKSAYVSIKSQLSSFHINSIKWRIFPLNHSINCLNKYFGKQKKKRINKQAKQQRKKKQFLIHRFHR